MRVTKRNGELEELDYTKIEEIIKLASSNLDINISDVLVKAKIQFYEAITTSTIQELIIQSAADLISVEYTDYQYLAANLLYFHLAKNLKYFESFYELLVFNIDNAHYSDVLTAKYRRIDIDLFDKHLKNNKPKFTYAGLKQFESKYLLKDRELPEHVFMLISMHIYSHEDENIRIKKVLKLYDLLINFKISLPSPILKGLRTNQRQLSSCALIECSDSLESITETTKAILSYISNKAGLGINVGKIRCLGDKVRKGDVVHTGITPFLKLFQQAVRCCSQGGYRGGSATTFMPIFHKEIETYIHLKNNKGTDETSVRHLDHAVQINKFFYDKYIDDEEIHLFSPADAKNLWTAFYKNSHNFISLYNAYVRDPKISKTVISARTLFDSIFTERAETARLYIQNIDHSNDHSSFDSDRAPIKQSNLCMEITLPTVDVADEQGEIALCTLAAINLGNIEFEEIPEVTDILVTLLNNILDFQDYKHDSAKRSTEKYRPLGIGITNFAYFLAKNKLHYSDKAALNLTHKWMESIQYHLIKASLTDTYKHVKEMLYDKGFSPINHYCKNVDSICDEPLHCNWEDLKNKLNFKGVKNATFSAIMPCESSSIISNSTNGIEPIKSALTVKGSKSAMIRMIAPEFEKYKEYYDTSFNVSNKDYINLVAVMQKFVDQSISANTRYDPANYPDNKVSMHDVASDIFYAHKMGLKTLYYHNTRDGSQDFNECESCTI